jgi:tetratricopeptide (TPR) repeat protein
MLDQARLLLRLWWRPAPAMSGILDRGSLLFACVGALAASLLLPSHRIMLAISFYAPLLALAAVYVPGTLLVANLLGRRGGVRTVFERDYSPLLTCTAMAWTAVAVPLALAAWVAPPMVLLPLAALAGLYFLVLMFFAVRTVAGASNGAAAGTVAVSWILLAVCPALLGPLHLLSGWLASPLFLLFVFYYLGNQISGLGAGLRSRQNFRRMLEASALNPHDAGAQYQLGLIYQQRRQNGEAIQRFRNAVAIDPREADAHFQLGRIAREQGRLNDALAHFQTVLDLDDKHSQHEILREIGAMYLAARQYEHARRELAAYIQRRPYDPEGLCYYGQALERLGDAAGAREMYARSIEAARTAPPYLRRETAKWSRLSQKYARKLA